MDTIVVAAFRREGHEDLINVLKKEGWSAGIQRRADDLVVMYKTV
jgi:hypothetical protein